MPRSIRAPLALAALALAGASLAATPARAQTPPTPPDASSDVPLAFSVPVGRPLLVETSITLTATVHVAASKAGAGSETMTLIGHQVFIDEHKALDKAHEDATRSYLLDNATENGAIADGLFNGLDVHYTRSDAQIFADLAGNRRIPESKLKELLGQFQSLGLWLDLPEKAKPGSEFKVNFLPLAPVLIGSDLPAKSASALLSVASRDAVAGTARLEGKLTAGQEGYLSGAVMKNDIVGALSLEVNVAERRIDWLALDATFVMKPKDIAPGTAGMTMDGTLKTALTTATGATVDPWKKYKPVFRKRPYRIPNLGVTLTLPSYFATLQTEKLGTILFRTIECEDGIPEIQFVPIVESGTTKQVFDQVEAAVKKDNKSVSKKTIKSPLGEGRGFTFTRKDTSGSTSIEVDCYPWGGKFILVRLVGAPKAFKSALKDFETARGTLSSD